MNLYIYISTAIFALLSLIWTKKGWFNLLLKVVFFTMTISGIINALHVAGFVIVMPK